MIATTYRNNDATRWGNGVGRKLTSLEVDGNFWTLAQAIVALQTSAPQPNNISSITVVGSAMTIFLDDGTTLGPFPLPVLQFRFRGDWVPSIAYSQLDIFVVPGVGVYMVLISYQEGTVFNAGTLVGGLPALQLIFGIGTLATPIYDIGFYYPSLLADVPSDVSYLYQEPLVRKILLPAVPTVGSTHEAYLQNPATTNAQVLTIYQNGLTAIGTISFAIGANVGTVAITADTTFNIGDRLAVGKPALSDATAEGLSVAFAGQQVI